MKDLYSFSKTEQELDEFYEKAIEAYKKVFARLGIGDRTYLTLASGGSFSTQFSHEFQTLTDVGEDTIYIHKGKKYGYK
jgi:prolyl-tRNA synthetase